MLFFPLSLFCSFHDRVPRQRLGYNLGTRTRVEHVFWSMSCKKIEHNMVNKHHPNTHAAIHIEMFCVQT